MEKDLDYLTLMNTFEKIKLGYQKEKQNYSNALKKHLRNKMKELKKSGIIEDLEKLKLLTQAINKINNFIFTNNDVLGIENVSVESVNINYQILWEYINNLNNNLLPKERLFKKYSYFLSSYDFSKWHYQNYYDKDNNQIVNTISFVYSERASTSIRKYYCDFDELNEILKDKDFSFESNIHSVFYHYKNGLKESLGEEFKKQPNYSDIITTHMICLIDILINTYEEFRNNVVSEIKNRLENISEKTLNLSEVISKSNENKPENKIIEDLYMLIIRL